MTDRRDVLVACLLAILAFMVSCNPSTERGSNKYIVELVGVDLPPLTIKSIAEESGIVDATLYQWKNHTVIYSATEKIELFTHKMALKMPTVKVKVYDKPFYNFTKSKRCEGAIALEWKHILLTANLVKDKKMQKEYLDYHKTQFSEWPEISQGFCNADFQQLLVYKNGRQLMLVISIPADKTLDELNPKTTENNPRVDEWNSIMGKYQEGIEGTEPGEKWVFLDKIE